jgi:sugar-specific transcriptional regulator TrmB
MKYLDLTLFGYSNLQSQIYETLLRKGDLNINELAKTTGKYRPAIYSALPKLISSALVTEVKKGKRKYYHSLLPTALLGVIRNTKSELLRSIDEINRHLKERINRPKLTVFDGKEGIRSLFEYLISSAAAKDTIYRFESPRDYIRAKKYYPALYWKRAGAKGDLNKFVLTNPETDERRHKNLNRFSKAVPINKGFDYNITQLVLQDKVAFIDYDTNTALLMENKRFAEFQRTIFKLLYEFL